MTDASTPGRIVIDARCLQDPNYADRGVGRHTVNLLRRAPRREGWRIFGIVDPLMAPLAPEMAALFDSVHPNAQATALCDAACFVSPSPMTHDPLFVARLLDDARPLKAAVVYDFIPYEFPDRYLTQPKVRFEYFVCLKWLRRYDLFLPISDASAVPLRTLLGIEDDRLMVAGAALDPVFETAGPPASGFAHVLVIGGGDPRKNVECAIRAHAVSSTSQFRNVPLVITGNYTPEQVVACRRIATDLGALPGLLMMPGHVPEATLVGLYRDAICVIAPSRAEGFDLPVVEAMATGAPALASDIPAHRELVGDAAWRFEPDDHARLSGLIDRLVAEPTERQRLVTAQAPTWRHFRAAARRASIGCQKRLATAAATCAELGLLTDLHVFTPTEHPAPVAGAACVLPLGAIANLSADFDRVINVMGNSHFHLKIFDQLLRYGGACISHDSRMLGFYRILLGMERATNEASKELGRRVESVDVDRWIADEGSLEALFLGEIAASASPMLVHSPVTQALTHERYGVTAKLLPFCIYRPWRTEQLANRAPARRRLALRDDEVIIVTFGHVDVSKAPLECIWALEVLRGWGIDATLHFVGTPADQPTLEGAIARLGLHGKVTFLSSYVSDETYRDYLLAADLAIQLRLTYLGSLSGALQDCIAAGIPTVTNASLAMAMGVPDYVHPVPDALSPLLIAEALADLLDSGLAHARPEAARQAYADAHSFSRYASQLCDAIGLGSGT
jgi:glycosyltransferase involved in cell wall biosynthesis